MSTNQVVTANITLHDTHAANSRVAASSHIPRLGIYELTGGDQGVLNFLIARASDPKQALPLIKEINKLSRHLQATREISDLRALAQETLDAQTQSRLAQVLKDEEELKEMRKNARNPAKCRLVIRLLNQADRQGKMTATLYSILNTAVRTANAAGFTPVSHATR
jgi:tellurite resistance protein